MLCAVRIRALEFLGVQFLHAPAKHLNSEVDAIDCSINFGY